MPAVRCTFHGIGAASSCAVPSAAHAGDSSSSSGGATIDLAASRGPFGAPLGQAGASSSPSAHSGDTTSGFGATVELAAFRGPFGAPLGEAGASASPIPPAAAAPPARGSYGALAGNEERRPAYGRLRRTATAQPQQLLPEGRAPLARQPTYAALERTVTRPKTQPNFELADQLEREEPPEAAHSARAAFRSWSITGGTRDASFRKRAKPAGDSGDGRAGRPARSVGFAAVLSMSGWTELDAEEVVVGDLNTAVRDAGRRLAQLPAASHDGGTSGPSDDEDAEGGPSAPAVSFVKRRRRGLPTDEAEEPSPPSSRDDVVDVRPDDDSATAPRASELAER